MTASTVESVARDLGRDHENRFNRRMPGAEISSQGKQPKPLISDGFTRMIVWISGAGLAVALAIFFTAIYLGNEIAKGGYSDGSEKFEVLIGNTLLDIEENRIRFSSQRREGVQDKVDLYLHWPTMAGYNETLKSYFTTVDGQDKLIFVSLEPRSMPLDMAGRIGPIYNNFIVGVAVDLGNGLYRQALSAESGYIDEYLAIEQNSPHPFVARCLNETSGGKPFCIRDIQLGLDLMVTYRFHASLLPEWLELDRAVRETLKSMLVK